MADALDGLTAALADRYRLDVGSDGQPPLLGQGGMATVYLAHDLKHHRKVAVKLIRPNVAAAVGAERFLHEIQVTANLQHPHILGLIDSGVVRVSAVGEAAVTLPYYVMPYVEGESLRQKLSREIQLPVEEALAITKAVASALDYAHRHGVIHRDIKPENILLHEGQALVADFGIALALTAAGGARLTETGVALGTPQYMSPEQGVGEREVGPRSDIFALGCVLYEMLAGEPPFTGPTSQAILAKTVRDTPQPLRGSRPSVPVQVEAAVSRALEKLPADRFETPGQFAEALARPLQVDEGERSTARGVGHSIVASERRVLPLAGALLVALAAAVWGWWPKPAALSPGVKRFEILLPPDVPAREIVGSRIAVAPDGSSIAFLGIADGVRRLFLRPLGQTSSLPLPGTEGASVPFFSWDSKWLGFMAGGQMKKVPVAGGAAQTIATIHGVVEGASWGERGAIVYATLTDRGLWQVSAEGNSPHLVARPDSEPGGFTFLKSPSFLPGGGAVLITAEGNNANEARIVVLATGRQTVLRAGANGTYAGGDKIVFTGQDDLLRAARIEMQSYRFTEPDLSLNVATNYSLQTPEFAVSHEGTLAYLPAVSNQANLVLVDRRGTARPITNDSAAFHSPRFSPDGAAVVVGVERDKAEGLWLYGMSRPTVSKLTFNGQAHSAAWAPDGRTLAYGRATGIGLSRPDQPGTDYSLLVTPIVFIPDSWTPDGRWLVATEQQGRLWLIPRDTTLKPRRFSERPFFEFQAAVSPDGRWLAYTSNESGQWEVYVDALLGPGSRAQVSLGGGLMPVWNRNGTELFYRSGNRLVAAAVTTGPSFAVGSRLVLFESPELRSPHIERDYDVSPDGQHFVMLQRAHPLETLVVVLNWFDGWANGRSK